MEIPVPTFGLANVKTGEPPKVKLSPTIAPDTAAVPEAVARVVPSYALLFPKIPIMVTFKKLMSPDNIGCVSIYFPASAPLIV